MMQDTPTGKQLLVYYGITLNNIEAGPPPGYQGVVAAVFTFQKASSLTL